MAGDARITKGGRDGGQGQQERHPANDNRNEGSTLPTAKKEKLFSDANNKSKETRNKKMFDSLQTLRFVAAMQIVGFHFYINTPWELVNNANRWGNAPLVFFWLLSGFVMAITYGRSTKKKIDLGSFMLKRIFNLYPLYLLSVMAGYLIMPDVHPQPLGLLLVLLFCSSGFIPSAFINSINTPCWTVGPFLLLYLLFPYSLRMIKASSPTTRKYVFPLLFYFSSMARPLLDTGCNMGILTPMARIAAVASVPNFLQGINLGLLFLEHDWSHHPKILQRCGLSAAILCMTLLIFTTRVQDLPIFFQLWRSQGGLAPLYMVIIWYGANGRDIICPLLELRPCVYLGHISFAIYLFQQWTADYQWKNNAYLQQHGYPSFSYYTIYLVILSACATQLVQMPYTQYLTSQMTNLSNAWRGNIIMDFSLVIKLLSSLFPTKMISMSFLGVYIYYVNYSPCLPLSCQLLPSMGTIFPQIMSTEKWFGQNDLHWLLNWYSIPCHKWEVIPSSMDYVLLSLMYCVSIVGLGAFCILRLTAIRGRKGKEGGGGGGGRKQGRGGARGGSEHFAAAAKVSVVRDIPPLQDELVFRVLIRSTDSHQAICQTFEWLSSIGKSLKKKREEERDFPLLSQLKLHMQVLGLGALRGKRGESVIDLLQQQFEDFPFSMEVIAPGSSLEAAIETVRRRNEQVKKSLVLVLCGGIRLTVEALHRMLLHGSSKAVVAFPTDVDGCEESLPSLGTMTALGPSKLQEQEGDDTYPLTCSGPLILLGYRHILDQKMPASFLRSWVANQGVVDMSMHAVGLVRFPERKRKESPYGYHTCSSLTEYMERKLALAGQSHVMMQAIQSQRGRRGMMSRVVAWLIAEACLHLVSTLALFLLVATPVHTTYSKGFYMMWGNGFDCSNGKGEGISWTRKLLAVIAGSYTTIFFANFVSTYQVQAGGALAEAWVALKSCLIVMMGRRGHARSKEQQCKEEVVPLMMDD